MSKLWGGRFQKQTDKLVEDFHSSIGFDQRLYLEDIQGSIAHAKMLGVQNIISIDEANTLINGLKELQEEIQAGQVKFDPAAEDIHMNIETLLTAKVGEVGKKLHTGRSRNDQVALDIKLYLQKETKNLQKLLLNLQKNILKIASENLTTIMPSYTHLQKAQPITLAHHIMAYFAMFQRDLSRFADCVKRANTCPLGSGALATTTFPLDRQMVASELGFADVTHNSLDGVSDRDHIVEFQATAAIVMMHFSRLCEEIILWSSDEFGFITLDDAYSTGSSIMPQKKNPDVAELIRGKTGRVYGNLLGILTTLKSLPLAYNKDMQEDKESFFDTIDTLAGCLLTITPMLATMRINKDKMLAGAQGGFTNATDVADYLAKKGLPFREAHHVVGKIVFYCLEHKIAIDKMTLEQFQKFSPIFGEDIYSSIDLQTCVNKRILPGGPAPVAVEKSIASGEKWLSDYRHRNI